MAKTPDFKYAPMFQIGEDKTEYRLIAKEGVSTAEFEGKTILKVSKEALTLLAQQGFHDVEFNMSWTPSQPAPSAVFPPPAASAPCPAFWSAFWSLN